MTTEQAVNTLSNLLGGFDLDEEAQVTDVLEQLHADSYDEGFDAGIAEGTDLAALDLEERTDGDEEDS